MRTLVKDPLRQKIITVVALQTVFLVISVCFSATGSAQIVDYSKAEQIQGVYVANTERTLSFRKGEGVVRTYEIAKDVRTIYTNGNEIDPKFLIFGSRCELKVLDGVILEIVVIEEPS